MLSSCLLDATSSHDKMLLKCDKMYKCDKISTSTHVSTTICLVPHMCPAHVDHTGHDHTHHTIHCSFITNTLPPKHPTHSYSKRFVTPKLALARAPNKSNPSPATTPSHVQPKNPTTLVIQHYHKPHYNCYPPISHSF